MEEKVTSKTHLLLPNCSEELRTVTDALADCRLPNPNPTQLLPKACNLTSPEFQQYFQDKFTKSGSASSWHLQQESNFLITSNYIIAAGLFLSYIIGYNWEFIIEEVRMLEKSWNTLNDQPHTYEMTHLLKLFAKVYEGKIYGSVTAVT